jgi:hypothetical protein
LPKFLAAFFQVERIWFRHRSFSPLSSNPTRSKRVDHDRRVALADDALGREDARPAARQGEQRKQAAATQCNPAPIRTSRVSLPSQNGAIAFRIEFHDRAPQRLAKGASRPSTTIFAFTILVGQ